MATTRTTLTRVSAMVDADDVQRLSELAKRNERTLAAEIRIAIRDRLAAQQQQQ